MNQLNGDHKLSGTIMIVDDDPNFRDQLKEFLKGNGFDAVGLESASHALKYIQMKPWSWHPWLVLTDLVMDGMGGYQFMRRVNELYPTKNIPFIVISKLGSAEDLNEAELAGAKAYLTKPLETSKMLEIIESVRCSSRRGMLVFNPERGRRTYWR